LVRRKQRSQSFGQRAYRPSQPNAVNGPTHVASKYSVNYSEDAKVGYKWYEAMHKSVLFPFGFGLSYTSYKYSDMKVEAQDSGASVHFKLKNTGSRAGTEIAQVYVSLPEDAGESYQRLAAWQRVDLQPGEEKAVDLTLDPRVLTIFDEQKNDWKQLPGLYRVVAGSSSADAALKGTIHLQ
jgi:beta-glucosidase